MTKNTIYKKRNDKYESRSNERLMILKKKRTYRSNIIITKVGKENK